MQRKHFFVLTCHRNEAKFKASVTRNSQIAYIIQHWYQKCCGPDKSSVDECTEQHYSLDNDQLKTFVEACPYSRCRKACILCISKVERSR